MFPLRVLSDASERMIAQQLSIVRARLCYYTRSVMIGTLINSAAIILGSLIGLIFKRFIPASFRMIIMTATGAITLVLGISMAMEGEASLPLLFALMFGGFLGFALRIEDRILALGDKLKGKSEGSEFAEGFLVSSVLFCSGAMGVVGSIQSGTTGDYQLLIIKSVMDGMIAIAFAAMYGKGVIFSSFAVLIYQGFFTLSASFLSSHLGESGIGYISSVGGYLLVILSLNLLDIKNLKTGNFLPSIVLAPVFGWVYSLIA